MVVAIISASLRIVPQATMSRGSNKRLGKDIQMLCLYLQRSQLWRQCFSLWQKCESLKEKNRNVERALMLLNFVAGEYSSKENKQMDHKTIHQCCHLCKWYGSIIFWYSMWRTSSLNKSIMLKKVEENKKRWPRWIDLTYSGERYLP